MNKEKNLSPSQGLNLGLPNTSQMLLPLRHMYNSNVADSDSQLIESCVNLKTVDVPFTDHFFKVIRYTFNVMCLSYEGTYTL